MICHRTSSECFSRMWKTLVIARLVPEISPRLATIHSLARFIGERSPEHVSWCGKIRTVPLSAH